MSFREEADWDAEPEEDAWFCAGCRRGHGCDGDPRCESHADAGPTQGPYDATKAPPALLDPHSVLRNRRRTDLYLATGGLWTWPPLNPVSNLTH